MESTEKHLECDVAVIGGGLAGIAAAFELLDRNQSVILLERDARERFGGLARESFGGVMMVGTPHQKRMGIRDTPELALSDWRSFADFDKKDIWPERWAETYVNTSIEMIYRWLSDRSVKFLPVVNWPERGLFLPGNSVPRWHIAWGTGYGIIESILKHLERHPRRANLTICFGHRVERILQTNGAVSGCAGRREDGSGDFTVKAGAVVAASGGICGGDLSFVKQHWFSDWGDAPDNLLNGSHRFADASLHQRIAAIGGCLTHLDLQWHYAAGIHHPQPDRHAHGLSLVPPRSALWFNAHGERFGPLPLMGYTDTRYLVEQVAKSPGQYSWLVMNRKIALKELAVSGCEYMTAFRYKKKVRLMMDILFGNRELVDRLIRETTDVVTASSVTELAGKMNSLGNPIQVDARRLEADIRAYDDQIERGPAYFNDDQLRRIANFRNYRGDRIRTCRFQTIVDRSAMPLIAIRSFILSRKSLGGVQTDLGSRVMDRNGDPIPGLYAAGETAGFGGGGIHGKRSLEGTFLGSCVLTGRLAAMAITGERI